MKYLVIVFLLFGSVSCNEPPIIQSSTDSFELYCKWTSEYGHKSVLFMIEGKTDSAMIYLGKSNAASDAANYEYSKLGIK